VAQVCSLNPCDAPPALACTTTTSAPHCAGNEGAIDAIPCESEKTSASVLDNATGATRGPLTTSPVGGACAASWARNAVTRKVTGIPATAFAGDELSNTRTVTGAKVCPGFAY